MAIIQSIGRQTEPNFAGSGGVHPMQLAEWRKQAGYNQQQLADLLGVTQPTVSYLERSRDRAVGQAKVPGWGLMRRIWTVTQGAVAPNDFYDLPPIGQAELPLGEAADCPLLEATEQ